MANKYVKDLSENTSPASTDAVEIDDGVNSEYVTLANLVVGAVTPGTSGNVLTSNGTAWTSAAIPAHTANTIIEGMRLIWNSTTSLSVDVGSVYAENGDLITATSVLTASSLSLSNSTWYHIYVYLSTGTPTMEVVTTAPVAWKSNAYSKTGATTHRYIGSIKTTAAGAVYKFIHNISSNYIGYMNFTAYSAPFRCLDNGSATSATSVDLSGAVPVTTSLPFIKIANAGSQVMRTSDDSGLISSLATVILGAGNVVQQAVTIFHPTTTSQTIYYMLDGASSGAYIDVLGYTYKR